MTRTMDHGPFEILKLNPTEPSPTPATRVHTYARRIPSAFGWRKTAVRSTESLLSPYGSSRGAGRFDRDRSKAELSVVREVCKASPHRSRRRNELQGPREVRRWPSRYFRYSLHTT